MDETTGGALSDGIGVTEVVAGRGAAEVDATGVRVVETGAAVGDGMTGAAEDEGTGAGAGAGAGEDAPPAE